MKFLLSPSWKTTVFGLATGLGLIFNQLALAFDGKDDTNPSWLIIGAGITAILQGFSARDANVSDEHSNTKGSGG